MKSQKVFHVLAALPLGSASGRMILNGVHRFLGEGYAWDIELLRRDLDFARLHDGSVDTRDFDGLIVAYAETPEMRRHHQRFNIPTVFVDYPDPIRMRLKRRAFVHDDEKSIAKVATAHLLSSGRYKCFAFVPARTRTEWSQRRQQAFATRLSICGHSLETFEGSGSSRDELAAWLRKLPKPAAILAAFDDRAVNVLECCHGEGIRVPDDVAVLGVGNDELVCETTHPPLSSVLLNFDQQGYRAARELQALMLGGRSPRVNIGIGADETIIRQTTPGPVNASHLAARALAFIQDNALKGISSRDVVATLHVSRRLAELRFREVHGKSILQAILELRLDEVKRLLSTTSLRADEIAMRCGYKNANVLGVLFRRATGISMRAWKNNL